MKVFIMTDLEGVAGVQDSENWCFGKGKYYFRARELLTAEVNAAIEGFLEAGAEDFLVADGHGGGAVDHDRLHPRARVARNWPEWKTGSFSIEDEDFDFAAWVGQHPMAGTVKGHLCHTGNMGVVEQRVNDIVVGEFGDLALMAGELGIRSVFASGCEAFCAEARSLVPGIETASVKRGVQTRPGNHLPADLYRQHNKAAVHLHPEEARRKIREGAGIALKRARNENFGLPELPEAPYERVRICRGDAESPPTTRIQTHPTSLVEMHRAPFKVFELEINPASPELRKLIGKQAGVSARP